MRTKTMCRPNPIIPQPYSRQQSIGSPAVLSLSFAISFWNIKHLKRERMNKLIMTDEISVVSTRMGKPSLVFRGYQSRIHLKNSKLSWVYVIDKYSKSKGKLKTDLWYEMASKTGHSFVPNPIGMEVNPYPPNVENRVNS